MCRREGVRPACRAGHLSFCVRTTELCVHVLCVTPFILCQNDRVVCACAVCHTFHSVSERPSCVCVCCVSHLSFCVRTTELCVHVLCVTPFILCQNDRVVCACAVCRTFHSVSEPRPSYVCMCCVSHLSLCVRTTELCVHVLGATPFTLCQNNTESCVCMCRVSV